MAAEPSLPFLPPPGLGLTSAISKRKGTYADDPMPSSDPPLFSSDDHVEAGIADNEMSGPRKRQYRGRWWDVRAPSEAADPPRPKREFKRTADSGVWMASEDLESEDLLPLPVPEPDAVQEPAEQNGSVDGVAVEGDQRPRPNVPVALSRKAPELLDNSDDARVERIVQDCLERGEERVDLSGLDLEQISDGVLRPLRYMTRGARLNGTYGPLIPSIKMFLSHNRLRAVPSAIFWLENLTVLSLRGNNLTSLPPAIGRLKRLKELNVGGNSLRHLPFEILPLTIDGDLELLHIFPNPLLEPAEIEINGSDNGSVSGSFSSSNNHGQQEPSSQDAVWAGEGGALSVLGGVGSGLESLGMASFSSLGRRPMRHSISAVTYFGRDGGARLTVPPSGPARATGNAPSLVELCLRSLVASPYPIDLAELLSSSSSSSSLSSSSSSSTSTSSTTATAGVDWPDPVVRLLREMKALREAGGQRCSICARAFVSARVEWVEWWYCLLQVTTTPCHKIGRPKPFLRRGCSWNCVPL